MLKWLARKLAGDFPPKHIPLCDKCRTAYTVAGIIKPQISFDQMIGTLHQFGLLCVDPCGNFINPNQLPQQHSSAFELPETFKRYGINCGRCRTALVTLSTLLRDENDIYRVVPDMLNKNLVCSTCLNAFTNNINDISAEVISTVR